jgi:hypothetical protein
MALWPKQRCQNCGSPLCRGQCAQNAVAAQQGQQMAQGFTSLSMQQLMNQQRDMMMQMLTSPIMLGQTGEATKKHKPLPEESELCATGGLIGWRLWRIPCFGETMLSINGAEWKPREALRALCNKGATSCLGQRCECGIYAWKKRGDVETNEDGYNCIKGEVWLWGKIIEHEKGYRAEYAYPKSFEKSADAVRVAEIYGVKLI